MISVEGQRSCIQAIGTRTVEQLIDQDKVILDSFLIKLAKVTLTKLNQPVEKLKDKSSIGVALCDGNQVNVLVLDMAKGGASKGEDGRSNLSVGDDLNTKDVCETRTTVVSEGTED
jgi:hypothetical protein